MNVIKKKSPNFTPKEEREISMIVVHATAGQMPGALFWLTQKLSKVSCHYLIDRQGQVYQLVDDKNVAWHAGKSFWGRRGNCNLRSIGIELVNDNEGQVYPSKQFDALLDLTVSLINKYGISLRNVVRHADISPGRKTDPWGFPWERFKKILTRTVLWRGVTGTTHKEPLSWWGRLMLKIKEIL